MKLTTLILSGLLVLGSGWTGNALAHDVDRGYARHDHGQRHAPYRHHRQQRPWRHHHHRPYRSWRHGHSKRYYPTWHAPRHHDSWGIHLFFSGH